MLKKSSNIRFFVIVWMFVSCCQAQSWKPAMEGLPPWQDTISTYLEINFMPQGPLGKDWIYGSFLDYDGINRCLAYRKGGKWVPLDFTGIECECNDLAMYGDTMVLAGQFQLPIKPGSGDTIAGDASILYLFNDSLWTNPHLTGDGLSVLGDSMLIFNGGYWDSNYAVIKHQLLTTDGGQTWNQPFSIGHPTDSNLTGTLTLKQQILPNGEILALNNLSPTGSIYKGLIKWDGTQWVDYGGLHSFNSKAFDFLVYKEDIYLAGGIRKNLNPLDPGNGIAKWNGNQWVGLATGIENAFVPDIFESAGIIYAQVDGGPGYLRKFGDVYIPNLAGWDGVQWCGTPINIPFPHRYGVIKDTLYVSLPNRQVVNGDTLDFINYFDGDYLHGPNAICSTPGLGESENEIDEIQITPNPVADKLVITNIRVISGSYEIYNLSGVLVSKGKLQTDNLKQELDVSHLPAGVYTIIVDQGSTYKFVKH